MPNSESSAVIVSFAPNNRYLKGRVFRPGLGVRLRTCFLKQRIWHLDPNLRRVELGRIAAIRSPQALSLFRDVLAASASIPVVFPPMLIDAEANGRRFQEMHVDGGVTAPVLTLPEAFLLRNGALARGLRMNIYVLVNDKVERDFQLVPNSTIDIAARTSAAVTKTQIRSVLYQTFDFARRNNFEFHLTYIDKDLPSPTSFGFETSYMRSLYQYGYDKAKTGDLWANMPPSDDLLQNDGRSRKSAARQ